MNNCSLNCVFEGVDLLLSKLHDLDSVDLIIILLLFYKSENESKQLNITSIAYALGTSVSTASRKISQLRKAGYIVNYKPFKLNGLCLSNKAKDILGLSCNLFRKKITNI